MQELLSPALHPQARTARSFPLLLAVATAGPILLGGTFILTVLKENPLFWRNAGGYPLGLREFTLNFYYPLLYLNFIFCAVVTRLVFKRFLNSGAGSIFPIGIAIFFWALLLLDVGVLCADNLHDVIEGRPLHNE